MMFYPSYIINFKSGLSRYGKVRFPDLKKKLLLDISNSQRLLLILAH